MSGNDLLARLAMQAAQEGSDFVTLRAMVEEASERGAARALDELGLADDAAPDDLRDLRQLLAAWRDAKRGIWKAVLDWLVRGLLAMLLVGIALRLGLGEWVR